MSAVNAFGLHPRYYRNRKKNFERQDFRENRFLAEITFRFPEADVFQIV